LEDGFLSFKDYYNLITLVLKSSHDILEYLQIHDINLSMSEEEIIRYLHNWIKLDNTLDIYPLLSKDFHILKIRSEQETL